MIREYEASDIETVLRIWSEASRLAHPFLSAEFFARERELIRDVHMPNARSWVFETDSEVVGFVAMVENEVGALFVHPDRLRGGVGRALMETVSALHPTLEVEVFAANAIGRAFYDRYGFEVIGEHTHEPTGQRMLRLRYVRP